MSKGATHDDEQKAYARRLGARLRELRLSRDLQQKQVAHRAGVLSKSISRYEQGHILPLLPTLERLASALDVPLDDLLIDQT